MDTSGPFKRYVEENEPEAVLTLVDDTLPA